MFRNIFVIVLLVLFSTSCVGPGNHLRIDGPNGPIVNRSGQNQLIQNAVQGVVMKRITVAGNEVPGELVTGEKLSVDPGYWGRSGRITLTADVYTPNGEFLGTADTTRTIRSSFGSVSYRRVNMRTTTVTQVRPTSSSRYRHQAPPEPWIITARDVKLIQGLKLPK